jgi:hypothetical protein
MTDGRKGAAYRCRLKIMERANICGEYLDKAFYMMVYYEEAE